MSKLCIKKYDSMGNNKCNSLRLAICNLSESGNMDIIRYVVVVNNCDLMARDCSNITPLQFCIYLNHLSEVKYIVEGMKCESNCTDFQKKLLNHYACQYKHLDLCFIKNCDSTAKNSNSSTPIHFATLLRHLYLVLYLVHEEKFSNYFKWYHGRLPPHYACEIGRFTAIGYFIQIIYTIIKTIKISISPRPIGYLDVAQCFVKGLTCSPNNKGFLQRLLLLHACEYDYLDIVKYLIEVKKYDPKTKYEQNFWQKLPLHQACENGRLDVIKYLIEEQQCDKMATDCQNNTPLHIASSNGHLHVVQYLTEVQKCTPAAKNSDDSTPLHLASLFGHLDVVKYLIDKAKCNPSCTGYQGRLPIHYACELGQLNIIKYFIEVQKVDHMAKNSRNSTPLHLVAHFGHLDAVKFLIEKVDCDRNSKGFQQRLPLHYACENGHLHIMKYLIEIRSCGPMARCEQNLTPLHLAARFAQLHIVQYLIEELNCNPNCTDLRQRLSLHYACKCGHLPVIRYLIKQKCDPMAEDYQNSTSFHLAAAFGHLDVVKYLVEERSCDLSHISLLQRLPLHDACQNGHLDVVKYFIQTQNWDPTIKDYKGRTPLYIAAQFGHLEVVKYLVKEDHCHLDHHKDCHQKLPIHSACENGHLNVIKYFINERKLDPMVTDGNASTPLHLAALQGQLKVVRYLVEVIKCDPNCTGYKQRLPLHYACQNGHLDVVKYLIKAEANDPMARDSDYHSPLHLAAGLGHLAVVKYLINEGKCDPSYKGFQSRLPLHYACENGHIKVIKYLINYCDSITGDDQNITPLHLAAGFGHLVVVKYLVEKVQCDPHCIDSQKRLPLYYAVENGHLNIIKYFIEVQNCDNLVKDDTCSTLLHLASSSGYLDIVQYLINNVKVDPNHQGFQQRSPLHYACENGHLDVAKYLIDDQNCNYTTEDINGSTPLHLAALSGHLDLVKYLIDVKCDPYRKGYQGRLPIHYACETSQLSTIKYFYEIQKRESLKGNDHNSTPLHLVANFGHLEVVKYFIEEVKCSPNSKGFQQRHPLHYACENGHLDIIKYLIEVKKCDAMVRCEQQSTPLHLAARFAHLEIVKYLIEEVKCDPNCVDSQQRLPLHYACKIGHLDTIKYLTEALNSDNLARNNQGNTPLHLAALFGQLDAVKYFVNETKWNTTCLGFQQRLPLHYACKSGQLHVIRYLIDEKNCNAMAKDCKNSTPLHLAAAFGHTDVVKYLIEEAKCNPNCPGFQNRVPLTYACEKGQQSVIKYLVEVHNFGDTALNICDYSFIHATVLHRHMNVMKNLTESCLSFIGTRSAEDPNDAQFSTGQYKLISSLFKDQNIIHFLVLSGYVDGLQHICVHCRIDPVLLKNFKDIEKQVNKFDVLEFLKRYVDPLHEAAIVGDINKVVYYIEDRKWSPLLKDRHGNNLLHNAAQYGQLKIVKYLIERMLCDPFIKNGNGLIAVQLALNHGFYAVESYLCRITSTKPIEKKYSLSLTCCIVVMGNSGAGKSTLIKSITSKKMPFINQTFPVRGVKPCTPGIIPYNVENKTLGCVKIYDFSGHEDYYSSHETILEHCKYPIVIIVVDISLDLSKIKEQISFWIAILSNSNRHKNMQILVVGSHLDKCKDGEPKKEAKVFVESLCSGLLSTGITYHGFVECNCRYAVSQQMSTLHSKLSSITKALVFNHVKKESDYSNRLCASLLYYLKHEIDMPLTMTLGDLWKRIKQQQKTLGPTLFKLTDKDLLVDTCIHLSSCGHILFFPHDDCSDKHLLVLDEETILSKVHASLEKISAKIDNDMGMLEESELDQVLYPLPSDMSIKYLTFAQFCTVVSSESLISECGFLQSNKHYFFPNLVKAEPPVELFKDTDNCTDIYTWILQCDDNHFFTPRCIHTFFIQLVKYENSRKKMHCNIWKNGILMVHNNIRVRTVVQFTDQTTCLKLMMQCYDDQTNRMNLVKERSNFITLIKSLILKLNSSVKASEYFFLPQKFPLTDFRRIPVEKAIESVCSGGTCVTTACGRGSNEKIDDHSILSFLIFDSFQAIGMDASLRQILSKLESDCVISPEYFPTIASALQECQELQKEINTHEEENTTYKRLYQKLLQYSVFRSQHFQEFYKSQNGELPSSGTDCNNGLDSFCSDKLKIKDLYAIYFGLSNTCIVSKWKELGIALELRRSSLDIINMDHSGESQRCVIEVLARWLNGEGSPSTWKEAVKAVLSLSKNTQHLLKSIPKSLREVFSASMDYNNDPEMEKDDTSLREILTYLRDLGHKWFYLGLSLGIPYNALRSIEAESRDPQRRLQDILMRWLRDTPDHGPRVASWRSLTVGLKGPLVREFEIALKIDQEHPM